MPDVHLLTAGELRQVTGACRATRPELGTWQRALVTCSACLAPARPPAQVSSPQGAMAERALQELVRQACGVNGWLYYHTHRSQHSPAGFPDTMVIQGERLVAAELKREGQEPTPAHRQWLEAFQQVQVIETYVWRPSDLAQVLEVLS
jgi:hypothetical protein